MYFDPGAEEACHPSCCVPRLKELTDQEYHSFRDHWPLYAPVTYPSCCVDGAQAGVFSSVPQTWSLGVYEIPLDQRNHPEKFYVEQRFNMLVRTKKQQDRPKAICQAFIF